MKVKTSQAYGNFRATLKSQWMRYIPVAVILLVVILIGLEVPAFLTQRNLINILQQSASIGIMAIGMSFVFFVGGMDLSVASNMGLSGVIGALVMKNGGHPLAAAVLMLGVSTLIGSINGFAVARLNMIPFVVTLSMMYVADGLSVWMTEATSVTGVSDAFINVLTTRIWIIPVPVLIMLFLGLITTLVMKKSYLGRWMYAVGTNIKAARVSCIPIEKVKFSGYLLSGLFAGLAAIITTARLGSASAAVGQSILVLDVASSAVVGGVSFYGGSGSPLGAVVGALLITLISNSMNMLEISYYVTLIIKGFVIILFIGLQSWIRNRGQS
jgi:ribose/xylose/arabinose/galactoside ABC-type transport system permease subunit